jgi:mono/diheme cytochrome c family protein
LEYQIKTLIHAQMKKYLLSLFLAFVAVALIFTGACKHDPIEGPDIPPPPPDECDTANVTYPGTVFPILDQYCISCHSGTSPSAGLDFTDYETIAFIAQNGALLGSIRHEEGFSPMPQSGDKLSDCNIAKFEIWIRDTTFTEPPGGIPCDPDTVYFENTILPLLQSSCGIAGCHDPSSAQDDVILTDYASIIETGDVDPFDPDGSDLYEVLVEDDPDKIMPPPPRNPLTNDQIQSVYSWIIQGALNNYCDELECDTVNVTFSATVWPVIQNRCFGCHSGATPSGGVSLEDHADMVAAANSDRLMGAIRHEPGYSPMPQNGAKLSDCNITQIQKWINNGMPNN